MNTVIEASGKALGSKYKGAATQSDLQQAWNKVNELIEEYELNELTEGKATVTIPVLMLKNLLDWHKYYNEKSA